MLAQLEEKSLRRITTWVQQMRFCSCCRSYRRQTGKVKALQSCNKISDF